MSGARRINRTIEMRIALAAAVFAVLAPSLFVANPPLGDFANHAARLWLLAGGANLPPLDTIYEVRWSQATTNVAVDAVATAIGQLIPISIVSSALVALSFLLPPLGAALLNMAIFRRTHWWQILIFLFAWGYSSIHGLMNFHIGLGLALLAAALDVSLDKLGPWARLALRIACAGLLFSVHAFALAFYLALIGALVLGRDLAELASVRGLWSRGLKTAIAVLPLLLLPVAMMLASSALPGAHLAADATGPQAPPDQFGIHWDTPSVIERLGITLIPIRTYNHFVDLFFLICLAVPFFLAMAKRRLALHGGLFLVALILVVASQFMPLGMNGTWWLEKRLPNMAALMMAASLQPLVASFGRRGRIAVVAALLVLSVRATWIAHAWNAGTAGTLAVERVLTHVPPGAAVLPMQNIPHRDQAIWHGPFGLFTYGEPTYRHLPTLAIVQRRAFVPMLFTAAGKQPVTVRPPWSEIAVPEGDIPSPSVLGEPEVIAYRFPYLAFWRTRFDYLLLLNADMADGMGPLPDDPALTLVADEGFARLYRIVRSEPPAVRR
ncbi:hypothetical protein E8L99_04220 [Phreatobacter aquaticus]|uniref:YfhO family protein n=1 Tax=Phreatobacter aquaticus TaxID=2570229 RepID=A0A4D7QCW0_9HYPH|nr:hypothetical protein [Phreatobacter aquaticus]QCK85038.1 hypothetical protein E8L99_04220 [Phreatobacter aquaticus]